MACGRGRAEELSLHRDGTEVVQLAAWLDNRIAALSLSRRTAFAARLCFEEAVQNILMHGPPHGVAIVVTLTRERNCLEAVVRDNGPPFNPLHWRPTGRSVDLQQAPLGGLGIVLMRQFATAVWYCRDQGWNGLAFEFVE